MAYSLDQLWQMEMDQLKLEQGKEPDPNFWRWSPKDIKDFDVMLCIARQLAVDNNIQIHGRSSGAGLRKISLAEAGCGIGTKLYLAKNKYDITEYGFDINDEYLQKCRELGVQAEKRNLADMDNQPAWSAYDIVYIARPFKDDLFENKWERSVHDGMRPGAVLIAAFAAVKPYTWPCYFRSPFSGVWVKPLPGKAYTPAVAKLVQKVTLR